MITSAFIHEYGNGKMESEHQGVKTVLESRNIPTKLFTNKLLDRRRLNLSETSLVVGEIPVVLKALKYLGITNLATNCYPNSIKDYLKRNVWESSIAKVSDLLYSDGFTDGLFVKPRLLAKKFTGCVINSPTDIYQFQGASKQTTLYCSEVVNWISEFRVFVKNSEIVGLKNYGGDTTVQLNIKEVEECINKFEQSDDRTDGYGIDFGVLDNGETALIEWNDGFSLGSYGLDKEIYTELLIARWEELMKKNLLTRA